ncbi:MAG TPA: diguanylate cyclase [Polyangiaceae bacterium]|jgi:diguanylate cyclase (GGDEF)-like protein|nr:MAG: Phytochrome-like protein cph2 [Deltaproteobacteria bacterium ADurb.Bin207]HNS96426.1 diguanylate cyclase [Polyangiaceae bacterium]HNZ22895.1 diguanylate cyclase [Polyangiaceae bacterium]HOD21274.1 diguanylate cyclase [Polyangiaceae bacterium]HOE48433.1 diguanylate cyclase [Polyangiaceae bacterium]
MPDSHPSPCPQSPDDLNQIVLSPQDLAFERLVTKAILQSLQIDKILYVVLSGVTSGEGLGFNRGLFLLADDGQRSLRTGMAVGAIHREEAFRIWEEMVAKDLTLEALLSVYDSVKDDPDAHQLSRRLGYLHLSLENLSEHASMAPDLSTIGRCRIETMLAQSLLERRPLHSQTLELACEQISDSEPFSFVNWWIVPLLTSERIVGCLVVDHAFSDGEVSVGRQHLLATIADLSAIAIEKSKIFDEMRALAQVDGLTGLANRHTYNQAIHRLLTQGRQTGRPLSIIVLDIDHFKRFNDKHGHLAGDDALRFVASVLRANARKTDIVARYGGEEFVVVLPDTTYEQALSVAEKLISTVRVESTTTAWGTITICAGVASSPEGGMDGTTLFENADKALYRAKRNGRDRVEGHFRIP